MKTNSKENDNPMVIPYGRAVRIGNFKLWRGRYDIASGKDRTSVECLHVSSLDGAWMTRIPATSQMFGVICSHYATADTDIRDNFLGMLFTNIYNVGNIPSPALHDGFYFLTEMMGFPYLLLPEKEMEKRMKNGMKSLGIDKQRIKEHVAKMMEYRRELYQLIERKKDEFIDEYERQQMERRAAEPKELERMEQDEIAEQAMDILNEEKGED